MHVSYHVSRVFQKSITMHAVPVQYMCADLVIHIVGTHIMTCCVFLKRKGGKNSDDKRSGPCQTPP